MREIWIISEGSAGHDVQSMSVADELAKQSPAAHCRQLAIAAAPGGIKRLIARKMMGTAGRPLPRWIRNSWLHTQTPPPEQPQTPPDIIISSGGKSVLTAYHLARDYTAPYVFIGERKPYPSEWFHTVFTPSPRERGINDVAIDLLPTTINPQKTKQAAADYLRSSALGTQPLWSIIIGGTSRSHPYTEKDWRCLGEGINALARRHNIRWLLTTSRRTSETAEKILQQTIEAQHLADAVWWATQPKKIMPAFLGAAEQIFVTQDSMTMITECIASGKPVTAIYPSADLAPDSLLASYLERLESTRRLTRWSISKMPSFVINDKNDDTAQYPKRSAPELAKILSERIKPPATRDDK